MKKILVVLTLMIFTLGLAGCDLFGGNDVPQVCDTGYHLEGTECVADSTNDKPVISLVGSATITIAVGDSYTDQGATASDTEDGDLSNDIVVVNSVNTAVAGTYTVTYNVQDSEGLAADEVVRTVIVSAPGDNPPVISLVGDATITITAGDGYTDQGATASDVEDGDLTTSIVVVNPVDPNTAGTYTITYNVTDSDGYTAATVTRTVIVTPSQAEALANFIVDNWDGSMDFLGLVVNDMDFSNAMTMTTELNFEVTEDIDETHYVQATVEDTFLYAETGNSVHRLIDVDVDNEVQVQLEIIFQEVETGVHVYIKYGPIFDAIAVDNPQIIDMLGWVGFTDDWALFQFDDSLQNVIQLSVVKDMLVSLFFSEMGEFYFYELQTQLETEIGFDLDQYGVDLGQFVDYLIEEDFDNAQLLLDGINVDGIVLHLDALYVAPQIYQYLQDYVTALAADGFDTTKIDLLNTAHDDGTGTMVLDVTLDGTTGTQAFFEGLTDTEWTSLIEIVIKPTLEENIYQAMINEVNKDWFDNDLYSLMSEYQLELENDFGWTDVAGELTSLQTMGAVNYWMQLTEDQKWALEQVSRYDVWMMDTVESLNWYLDHPNEYYESYWFTGDLENILTTYETVFVNTIPGFVLQDEIDKIQWMGGVDYWRQLSDWEREEIEYTVDKSWQMEIVDRLYGIQKQYEFLLEFMQTHETMLNDLGFDATNKIIALQTNGIKDFLNNTLSAADVEILMDAIVYPFIDDLKAAIDTNEVPEFIMQTIFTDPHVVDFLTNNTEWVPFDQSIIAANMMAIDFDALVNETVDLEALAQAIYDGQTAYDLFVTNLEATAPNLSKLLAVWSPAVLELEQYMVYVDDIQYAFDGLSVFDQYLTPDYWLADNMVGVDLTVTDDFYVRTHMNMDPIMYQILVQDVLDDLNTYLLGFQTLPFPYDANWECVDPLDTECTDADFGNLMALLTQLGDINVDVVFDPSDPTWVNTTLDLTDFLDVIVYNSNKDTLEDPSYVADPDNDILTGVTNATISVTVDEAGSITLPTVTSDVNAIAEEFGKFGVSMFARDILRDLVWHYEENMSDIANLTQTTYTLDDFDFLKVSKAFDPTLSTITVVLPTLPATMPEFSVTLYWIDGTEALNGTVSLADFQALFDANNEMMNQAAYDTMVGFVNETNYNMTKLFLMFMLND